MKTTPEQMLAVKDALRSILESKSGDASTPGAFPTAELDEALKRFFAEHNEFASVEEFVELLCRHLS